MEDNEEDRGSETGGIASSPRDKEVGEKGLGAETGGLDGHDEATVPEGGLGGDPAGGPTKDTTSPPGGGDDEGPSPGGVPKEGHVDEDADFKTGST